MLKYFLIVFPVLFLTTTLAIADNEILGLWVPEEKDAVYDFYKCGEAICAKVIELKEPLNSEGKPKVDSLNEDESLRQRPILGMQFLNGLKKKKKGVWHKGTVYNPRDGKIYKAIMKLKNDGTLDVRGFVGFSLIGKSTIFTRKEQ
tara:strand:- start:26 stop:463 length:438 start_codon:yes stop_codon:yes gene_type:complete